MHLIPLNPRKSLNKAYLKVKPARKDIERFKKNLLDLVDGIDEKESEEWHKNQVSDFLKNTYFAPDYYINTKGRNDLVIHNGAAAKSSVGVILETKNPANKNEMIRTTDLNKKAFHELVLYYLRERISNNNLEIKYVVATNIHEWFIFDARVFDQLFARNKEFVKQFTAFEEGRLASTDTDFFYRSIAEPYIGQLTTDITFTHFQLRDYEKPLRNKDKEDDTKLISLYKLLSPEHLLKLPFTNDSNSLDKRFYSELLHIIGLAETKEGGKKLIGRKAAGKRHSGSLLENAIIQLESHDKLSRLDKPPQYGNDAAEQLFTVALELVITWVNRILFLKLLEAQLVAYHKGDKQYAFLSKNKIADYDDLDKLFFRVLAKKPQDRADEITAIFGKVPYLNSSLFEPTDLEHHTLFINNLDDSAHLPLSGQTVLKDNSGKRRSRDQATLSYLFDFLDAYDFSGEGAEDIQEENKTLINASVLGLIFEKINGYKDGSFFTPGFITMYMCRETIRKAIIQKFGEEVHADIKTYEDVKAYTHRFFKDEDLLRFNKVINSMKLCDPAVGSGHFLVSALNEIIAIKSDLGILADQTGIPLKHYAEVENDELIITDQEGHLFEYQPADRENQRVQETLFHEKQTIIENCLFGVDINMNSVKICRLRLWIELLKNAYYKNENELETLPNIDINIKCGNSLISRFDLDTDISDALKKSKWDVVTYRNAVDNYKNATNKDEKRDFERLIESIKGDFETEISKKDKRFVRVSKLRGELFNLTGQQGLFTMTGAAKKKWQKDVDAKTKALEKVEAELEEIKNNRIYENAFEWRFEFPEVLDDEGNFKGFDVVIGNPPYIRQEAFSAAKPYLQQHYQTYAGTADLFVYFVEKGMQVLKKEGNFIFILPNKWMRAGYGKPLRSWIGQYAINAIVDFGDLPVFEEATTYPCIWHMQKLSPAEPSFLAATIDTLSFEEGLKEYVERKKFKVNQRLLSPEGWTLVDDSVQHLMAKIKSAGKPLGEYVENKIYRGVLTGLNEAFVIDQETRVKLIAEDPKSAEIIKPFLGGRDIKRYRQPESDKFLIFTRRGIDIKEYPGVLKHLENYRERLAPKPKGHQGTWNGRKQGTYKWYEIQDAVDYYNEFEKVKITWPETSLDNQFALVDSDFYLNKTTFFIPINDPFLLGILNSSLARFYFDAIVSKMRGGYFSMSKAYVETIPIKEDDRYKDCITTKVNEILAIRKDNSKGDISTLEKEIDRLVCELYGLSEEEIGVIAKK
ncbi:MAG: Eco57I restriction-modification methylase domain-containing protein [Fulvivirga sp.]